MENKTGETVQEKNNHNDNRSDNNGQDLSQPDIGCIGISSLQYSMSDEDLRALLPEGGYFTCEDLYSVVNPSSGTGVSELDSGNGNWQTRAALIPLNPTEIGQMQGNGNSTGSYIRVIVNNNEATAVGSSSPPIAVTEIKRSFSSEDLRNQEENSCNSNITQASDSPQSQVEVEASPQAGVSSQELGAPGATPMKVRKPRGRKPKHPKEASATTMGDSTTNDYTSVSNGAINMGMDRRSGSMAENTTDMIKKPILTVHHMGDANTGMNGNGRLEQLFSNRISNVVAAKRPIVTPSYIQRNMALYNQLTAPKKQCDFDIRKLPQDKWMQFPNPSILDDKNGRMAPTPNQMMQNLTGNTPNMQTQNHSQSNGGYAALDSTKNMNFRFPSSTDSNVNMNFRFPPPSDSNINMFNPQGNQLNGSQSANHGMNPMNVNFENPNLAYSDRNTRYVSASATSSSRNCQSHSTHSRLTVTALFHEMQSKIDTMYAEQQDLKVKCYYLSKTNKYLLNRSNQLFEEIEAVKSHIQLNGGRKRKSSEEDSSETRRD